MNCLNKPSAPRKGYDFPEPLLRHIAAYDQACVQRRMHRETPPQISRALWNFFSRFPSRHDPAKIWITDVEDYKAVRRKQIAWSTLRLELGYVQAFYNWLLREGVVDANPICYLSHHPPD